MGVIVASFVPTVCTRGGGYVGYSESPLKGLFGTPGSASCTDGMFEVFVLFGWDLCCLLPVFVNRQSPCRYTNSRLTIWTSIKSLFSFGTTR